MNVQSIILIIIIAAWLIYSLLFIRKHKGNNGCQGCHGNCSGNCNDCSSRKK